MSSRRDLLEFIKSFLIMNFLLTQHSKSAETLAEMKLFELLKHL